VSTWLLETTDPRRSSSLTRARTPHYAQRSPPCGSAWLIRLVRPEDRRRPKRVAQVINARIDAAEAVIALFSKAVAGADDVAQGYDSDWVVYEADRAHTQGKLIPLRVPPLPADKIPAPYPAVLHIIEHGEDDELLRALREKGVTPA